MKILQFDPKEDITTWELAQIFRLDTLMTFEGNPRQRLGLPGQNIKLPSVIYLDSLPENVKRHLVIREE